MSSSEQKGAIEAVTSKQTSYMIRAPLSGAVHYGRSRTLTTEYRRAADI